MHSALLPVLNLVQQRNKMLFPNFVLIRISLGGETKNPC